MNFFGSAKKYSVEIICYLFILLFVYAAVSKLLDFQNFRLQVAQSPLLTAYAGFFAVVTIVSELSISFALAVRLLRTSALYAAFALMCLFSGYIFFILNFSPYVPCSCGGILEKMGWSEHLVFNLCFVALGATGVVLNSGTLKRKTLQLFALAAGSFSTIVVLFLVSENTLHHRNNFVRRIPPFAIKKVHEADLGFNSFYLAGAESDKVYLGNYMAPSIVTLLDSTLQMRQTYRIALDDTLAFKAAQIKIRPPFFYIFDGSIPCIYRGKIVDWSAKLRLKGVQQFTNIEPIDSGTVAFRAATTRYGNLPGLFDLANTTRVIYKHGILEKQIDGIFDTDGTMEYDAWTKQMVFVYYYRNEYMVTDAKLNLLRRGNTIDTNTIAKIKVEYLTKKAVRKFAAPPLTVNRTTALRRNLLFVNSGVPGKFDPEVMWRKAAVVDVYDTSDGSYVMSFYVNNEQEKKMKGFIVTDTHLFALFETKIVAYSLHNFLTKEFKK
ncbi:MAG: hypothetical protein EOO51_00045 [Flavobacterium sp.]|nr:MAG: hypothetical protein EOO51_00045 [Flavobacterium sp.]